MPYRVNGIGTWYYGHRDAWTRTDTCESCKRYANLESYDTRTFICVLFIPLIPLKRLRVLDQCGSCQRHRVLPLASWQEQKAGALERAHKALRDAPQDPEIAEAVLSTFVNFQDRDGLRAAAAHVRKHFPGNAALLGEAGRQLSVPGLYDDALEVFRAAWALDQDDWYRHNLGLALIRTGHPEDAQQILEPFLHGGDESRWGLLMYWAEALLDKKHPRIAVHVLQSMGRAFPKHAEEKDYRKLMKKADKACAKAG